MTNALARRLRTAGELVAELDNARGSRAIMLEAADEIERLKQWVDDCQSGMYINCVYCGHRYGPQDEIPASMADVLKEHVEQCPKHPMSALRAELDSLRNFLGDMAIKRPVGRVILEVERLRKEVSDAKENPQGPPQDDQPPQEAGQGAKYDEPSILSPKGWPLATED